MIIIIFVTPFIITTKYIIIYVVLLVKLQFIIIITINS
jgi:hypothetical protein